MKIGIDIDGVLIDFEERLKCKVELFNYFERYKNFEVKNKDLYWSQERYGWSDEDWELFMNKYLLELSRESNIKPFAKEVLDLLKQDGHDLIVISARGSELEEMINIVKEKIKEADIRIDKYHWKMLDKVEICKNEKIDIMIDDNPHTCEKLSQNKIRTLYFRNIYGKELQENEYLKEVHDWGDIYHVLKVFEKNLHF